MLTFEYDQSIFTAGNLRPIEELAKSLRYGIIRVSKAVLKHLSAEIKDLFIQRLAESLDLDTSLIECRYFAVGQRASHLHNLQ